MAAFRLPRMPLLLVLAGLAPAAARADGAMPPSLGEAFASAMESGPRSGAAPSAPAGGSVLAATEVWGNLNPSSITLRASPPVAAGSDHVADVLFDNHLTTGNVDIKSVSLRIDGLVVHVTIVHGMDRIPDALEVAPPLGYVATPPSVLVEDGAVGVIEIHRIPVG